MLLTISLTSNTGDTSKNEVENSHINDTCFYSNPSDSYCAYSDSYNVIHKDAIGIDWNNIINKITKTDSLSFTTRADINISLGEKFKSIIYSFARENIALPMRGTLPDQYSIPIQTEEYDEFPFDRGETSVAHINNDLCHLMIICWKNASILNLKQTKEISIGEDQHGCLFMNKVVRYLTILKDHMHVKDTNISIIHGHGEYQMLYLDITMGSVTSIMHDY